MSAVQYSPDGKLLAISGTGAAAKKPSGGMQLWDLSTGKSVRAFSGLRATQAASLSLQTGR